MDIWGREFQAEGVVSAKAQKQDLACSVVDVGPKCVVNVLFVMQITRSKRNQKNTEKGKNHP